MVVAARVLVADEPPVARGPLQPPEAVQLVALLDDQVSVELPPAAVAAGVAANVTVGGEFTVTEAVALADPPEPLQLSVNAVVAVSTAVALEPLIARAPLQPPEALQAVALVELQFRVEVLPLAIEAGDAASETVGAGSVSVVALAGADAAEVLAGEARSYAATV